MANGSAILFFSMRLCVFLGKSVRWDTHWVQRHMMEPQEVYTDWVATKKHDVYMVQPHGGSRYLKPFPVLMQDVKPYLVLSFIDWSEFGEQYRWYTISPDGSGHFHCSQPEQTLFGWHSHGMLYDVRHIPAFPFNWMHQLYTRS